MFLPRSTALAIAVFALGMPALPAAEELPDIHRLAPDLAVPAVEAGAPAAGRRVLQTTRGWPGPALHHTLYLPRNWRAGARFPVFVEYPGNGGFRDRFGDVSNGLVEQCRMGYGLSGGVDYIWLSMPFVGVTEGGRANRAIWWGDADETAAYCVDTIHEICRDLGGDARAVIFCGFSRGSIAANYIGLRNDTIAPLWRAFICHSHYDGVETAWPYADADSFSALVRLQRLRGRPQFISQEVTTAATQLYLEAADLPGDFTFCALPFRNHTDLWTVCDCPARRQARGWLRSLGLPAPVDPARDESAPGSGRH